MAPSKRKKAAATDNASASKKPKRAAKEKPYRTPQTPHDKAVDNAEKEYVVEKILGEKQEFYEKLFLIKWEGFDDDQNTWEPIEHLAGCRDKIADYRKRRKEEDDAIAEQRKQRNAERAAERAAAQQKAREDSINIAVDLQSGMTPEEVAEGLIGGSRVQEPQVETPTHKPKSKRSACYKAFDDNGRCILPPAQGHEPDDDGVCGVKPKGSGGTQHMWQHLQTHHPETFLVLKGSLGQLTDQGQKKLTEALSKPAEGPVVEKLSGEAKRHLDTVWAAQIIEDLLNFNSCATLAFKEAISLSTEGKYDGVSEKTVKTMLIGFARDGVQTAIDFVNKLLALKNKPSASMDLWSKSKMALLGIVVHGILREKKTTLVPTPSGLQPMVTNVWTMNELLAGAVPCADERHTAENVKAQAKKAFEKIGVRHMESEIFKKLRDCGANIKKALELDDDIDCTDHTMETDLNEFLEAPGIAATRAKAHKKVAFLGHSTIGRHDFHAYQKQALT